PLSSWNRAVPSAVPGAGSASVHAVTGLQQVGIGAKATDGHLPGDRGWNLEDQVELDRHDEPGRLSELGIELSRSPARVAGKHGGAARRGVHAEDLPE